MLENSWHKKEKPLFGLTGLGGGVGSNLVGGSGPSYWFATLDGAITDVFSDVVLDSSDNIYTAGRTNSIGTGQNDFLVSKYDTDGAIQWQTVSGTGGSDQDQGMSIDIDSGGEIVVTGRRFTSGAYSDAIFQLFDSGGSASGGGAQYWVLSGSGTNQEYFTGSARNSSNETYLAGYTDATGSERLLIAKYDSSNDIDWQKTYGGSFESAKQEGKTLALDSSDNMYVVGWTNSGPASNNDAVIVKFNSSGVIQWQRGIGKSGNDAAHGVCLDSSDNVYVVGFTESTGGHSIGLILKYNSSGTIQWNRTFDPGSDVYFYGVCVDSSDNVYVCGGVNDACIVKYNSSGTIQWQRKFSASGDQRGYSMQCDSEDNLIIVGETDADALVLKLPNDGSLTGTYGSYTYSTTTYTDSTATMTEAALSFSASTSSLTASTVSNTTSTGTLTSSTTTL